MLQAIKREILGEESEDEKGGAGSGDEGEEEEESDEDEAAPAATGAGGPIRDFTETDLINLRRTIYLTIMSAMDFEEAGHKLLKIALADGQEIEVVTMLIECCSQEKTYLRCASPARACETLSPVPGYAAMPLPARQLGQDPVCKARGGRGQRGNRQRSWEPRHSLRAGQFLRGHLRRCCRVFIDLLVRLCALDFPEKLSHVSLPGLFGSCLGR